MARVPILRENTVALAPLSGARLQPANNGGGVLGGLGAGMTSLGGAIGKAAEVQDEIDLQNDDRQRKKLALEYQEQVTLLVNQYRTLSGEDAVAARVELDSRIAALRDTYSQQAQTPRARVMFQDTVAPIDVVNLDEIDEYARAQQIVADDNIAARRRDQSTDLAIRNLENPETRDAAIATGRTVVEQHADARGKGPEEAIRDGDIYVSSVHLRVIATLMATGRQPEAIEYEKSVRDLLIDDDRRTAAITVRGAIELRETEADTDRVLYGDTQDAASPKDAVKPTERSGSGDDTVVAGGEREADTVSAAPQSEAASAGAVKQPVGQPDKPKPAQPAAGKPRRAPVDDARAVVKSVHPQAVVTDHRRPAQSNLGRKNPGSWHIHSGAAIDVRPIPGMTFEQYKRGFTDAGYTIIEEREEVGAERSKHATGDHWHIVLGKPGSASGEPAKAATSRAPQRWDTREIFARLDAVAEREGWTLERKLRAKTAIAQRIASDEAIIAGEEKVALEAVAARAQALQSDLTSVSQLGAEFHKIPKLAQIQYTQQAARNQAAKVEMAERGRRVNEGLGNRHDLADRRVADEFWRRYFDNRPRGTSFEQQRAMMVQFSTKIGFVPDRMKINLSRWLRSTDPNQRLLASQAVLALTDANPAFAQDFDSEDISNARLITDYIDLGTPPQEAVRKADQDIRISPEVRAERAERYRHIMSANPAQDPIALMRRAFPNASQDMTLATSGSAGNLQAEFEFLRRREYLRHGNLQVAHDVSLRELKRTWGVTYINGKPQMMKYAPELFYNFPGTPAEQGRAIREQGMHEVVKEPGGRRTLRYFEAPGASDRLVFSPHSVVRNVNGLPVYEGRWRQPDGTYVVVVGDNGQPRIYQPDWLTSPRYRRDKKAEENRIAAARERQRRQDNFKIGGPADSGAWQNY